MINPHYVEIIRARSLYKEIHDISKEVENSFLGLISEKTLYEEKLNLVLKVNGYEEDIGTYKEKVDSYFRQFRFLRYEVGYLERLLINFKIVSRNLIN